MGAAAIVLVAGVGTVAAALLQVQGIVDVIKTGHKIPGISSVLDSVDGGGPQTILVLGSDGRWTERGQPVRSDTIMLIRLDASNNATAIMSLPRDLKVTIPATASTGRRRSTRPTPTVARS